MASWVCSAEYGISNLVIIGIINEWDEINYML